MRITYTILEQAVERSISCFDKLNKTLNISYKDYEWRTLVNKVAKYVIDNYNFDDQDEYDVDLAIYSVLIEFANKGYNTISKDEAMDYLKDLVKSNINKYDIIDCLGLIIGLDKDKAMEYEVSDYEYSEYLDVMLKKDKLFPLIEKLPTRKQLYSMQITLGIQDADMTSWHGAYFRSDLFNILYKYS